MEESIPNSRWWWSQSHFWWHLNYFGFWGHTHLNLFKQILGTSVLNMFHRSVTVLEGRWRLCDHTILICKSLLFYQYHRLIFPNWWYSLLFCCCALKRHERRLRQILALYKLPLLLLFFITAAWWAVIHLINPIHSFKKHGTNWISSRLQIRLEARLGSVSFILQ